MADPSLAAKAVAAMQPFAVVEVEPAPSRDRLRGQDLLLVDEASLAHFPSVPAETQVVAVFEDAVAGLVASLGARPWLSQVLTPAALGRHGVPRVLYGLLHPTDTLSFLGPQRIRARRVLLYRSLDVSPRLDRLCDFAEQMGARSRAVEQLHDITNELMANAIYDAPYEAGFFKRPPERQQSICLPPDMPCELVYGALEDEIFVRVRDCFGALTRRRLFEVLGRCAQSSGVALDESRGGAGLGLWRVFSKSSQVVVSVVPRVSTEMLITVPKRGQPRDLSRSWHLLFAPAELHQEARARHP